MLVKHHLKCSLPTTAKKRDFTYVLYIRTCHYLWMSRLLQAGSWQLSALDGHGTLHLSYITDIFPLEKVYYVQKDLSAGSV